MSRDADLQVFEATSAATGDESFYFNVGPRAVLAKRSYLLVVTAESTNDATVDVDWDYTTDGTNFSNICDTDDASAHFGDVDVSDTTPEIAALVSDYIDTGSEINVRIPANAVVRCNLAWTAHADGVIKPALFYVAI